MQPVLKEIVLEASQALARLDAARLEELALSCQAFNRLPRDANEHVERAREAGEAVRDMAVFARVLEATQANLRVMKRLQDLRTGQLEYAPQGPATSAKESKNGDD